MNSSLFSSSGDKKEACARGITSNKTSRRDDDVAEEDESTKRVCLKFFSSSL